MDSLKDIQEYLKKENKTLYIRADNEFLDIIGNILKKMEKENTINIGDVIAIEYDGFHKMTQEEIDKISPEEIVDRSIATSCSNCYEL